MDRWMFYISFLCFFASVLLVLWWKRRNFQMIQRMEKMLDDAIEGTFKEEVFDETKLSRLENRLGEYLAASEVSVKILQWKKTR